MPSCAEYGGDQRPAAVRESDCVLSGSVAVAVSAAGTQKPSCGLEANATSVRRHSVERAAGPQSPRSGMTRLTIRSQIAAVAA